MFQNWGFLLAEIWLLLICAALVGLLAGWLIWGRGLARLDMARLDLNFGRLGGSGVAPAKPQMLANPLGIADDLKQINGIGPALEDLCHNLGVWHFHQIAAWTPAEVAWVDANLEGFKGRVTRDDWVGQARKFAAQKKS